MCARLSGWVPKVIVCAAQASRDVHVRLGYEASKMMVIPNGYDFSRLQAMSAERNQIRAFCNVAEDEVVLGTLGRFHPDKDQQNFVRAAGMVAAEFPSVRFLMVGRALDWGNVQLVEWITGTGFMDRFILLGERSDVPQCLAAMDIFCLPSRSEGFPNVLIEAMAMGLPCVATDVGDAAVILAGGGELVAKEDSSALASAIGRLLNKGASTRTELGLKNQMRVRNDYAIERARMRFDAIYKRLTNQAGAI
jgi:glycosyltransferase involved in cell wall biosynthesis